MENSFNSALALSRQAQDPRLGRSVSIDQAADFLNVSRRTIYYRIRQGRLHTIRTLGGSQRVLVESLQQIPRPHALPTDSSSTNPVFGNSSSRTA